MADEGTDTKSRDVNYDDFSVEDLPAQTRASRTSVLRERVTEMFKNPDEWRKADGSGYKYRSLGSYGVQGSAQGAKQGLVKHFGRLSDGSGFEFDIRNVNGRSVLFAKFDPNTRKPDFPNPGEVPWEPRPVVKAKVTEGEQEPIKANQGATGGKTKREAAETPGA